MGLFAKLERPAQGSTEEDKTRQLTTAETRKDILGRLVLPGKDPDDIMDPKFDFPERGGPGLISRLLGTRDGVRDIVEPANDFERDALRENRTVRMLSDRGERELNKAAGVDDAIQADIGGFAGATIALISKQGVRGHAQTYGEPVVKSSQILRQNESLHVLLNSRTVRDGDGFKLNPYYFPMQDTSFNTAYVPKEIIANINNSVDSSLLHGVNLTSAIQVHDFLSDAVSTNATNNHEDLKRIISNAILDPDGKTYPNYKSTQAFCREQVGNYFSQKLSDPDSSPKEKENARHGLQLLGDTYDYDGVIRCLGKEGFQYVAGKYKELGNAIMREIKAHNYAQTNN